MSRTLALIVALMLILVACDAGSEESPAPTDPTSQPPSAPPSSQAAEATEEPATSGPTMTDEALGVEVAASGFEQPTGMAFIGEDEYFVIEKGTGEVHRVVDGDPGDPVLDLAVNFFDERGLLGIAVHPDFDANGYVYLYWTWSGEGEGEQSLLGPDTEEEFAVPELGNRVDRFVWDGEQLAWDLNIIEMRSNTLETDTSDRIRGNHDGGQMVFGNDGTLFFVNGDQNLRGELQNIEGQGGLDDANWTGVVVRVNDDGSVPEDNPFVEAASALDGPAAENLARTWAYGVRNSFGLAVHPETGALWQTENGDDSFDEVNILRAGPTRAGGSSWVRRAGSTSTASWRSTPRTEPTWRRTRRTSWPSRPTRRCRDWWRTTAASSWSRCSHGCTRRRRPRSPSSPETRSVNPPRTRPGSVPC